MDAPIGCRTVSLLGLDFADIDAVGAADSDRGAAGRLRRSATWSRPTPIIWCGWRAARRCCRMYRDALLRLLDSRVVARAAAALGLRVPQVTTGSDLTARLLCYHVLPGERVTIVGLRPRICRRWSTRCGIAPPAHHDPPWASTRDPAAVAASGRIRRRASGASGVPGAWVRRDRKSWPPPSPATGQRHRHRPVYRRQPGFPGGCGAPRAAADAARRAGMAAPDGE